MNIGLDMMGGDYAPLEAVKGVALFLQENKTPFNLFLFGDRAALGPLLDQHNIGAENLTIIDAPQVIGMHEHPTKALKEKPQSSIAVGFQHLATNRVDAFISAG